MRFTLFTLAFGVGSALSQQDGPGAALTTILSKYPDVSAFSGIISAQPALLTSLFTTVGGAVSNSSRGYTLLIPTNKALSDFTSTFGPLTSQPIDTLVNTFKYHILVKGLKAADISNAPRGLTVPTLLTDNELFNNRSLGAGLAKEFGADATGQVLFFDKHPVTSQLRVRQSPSLNLRAGLGSSGTVQAVDGEWPLGTFQFIDTVLTPPANCSATARLSAGLKSSLTSLDSALEKTQLWPVLDRARNVTCLAPSTQAFAAAGDPQKSLGIPDLTNALLFHTLPEVTYTDFLEDGAVFKSLANLTVRITRKGDDLFFNNAKVIASNVLTNNGLIHVLDKVMEPIKEGSPTSTGSGTAATVRPNAGVAMRGSVVAAAAGAVGAVVAVLA